MAGCNLSYLRRGLSATTSPLTIHVLRVWHRIDQLFSLAPSVSPLAPVGGFLWFPPGECLAFFRSWTADGNPSCGKFLENGRLLSLEALRGRFPLETLTPIEKLFIEKEPLPHLFSVLYKLLGSVPTITKAAFIREWERNLGLEFSAAQHTHIYQLTHSSSIESRTQETNYKLLTMLYRTPATLSHIYPSVPDLCWRGCGQRGTLLRLWWECPMFRPFWSQVNDQIKKCTGVGVPLSPANFLLHVPTIPLSHSKKSALNPYLLETNTCAQYRGVEIGKVNGIMELKEWVMKCMDRYKRF